MRSKLFTGRSPSADLMRFCNTAGHMLALYVNRDPLLPLLVPLFFKNRYIAWHQLSSWLILPDHLSVAQGSGNVGAVDSCFTEHSWSISYQSEIVDRCRVSATNQYFANVPEHRPPQLASRYSGVGSCASFWDLLHLAQLPGLSWRVVIAFVCRHGVIYFHTSVAGARCTRSVHRGMAHQDPQLRPKL